MIADRPRSGLKPTALLVAGMALSTAGIAYAAASSDDDKATLTAEKAPAEAVPDPVTQALKAAVRNGSISEERAIQVYSLLTDGLPGSSRQAKTEAYLEQAAAKLDAMVMTGELSAEDAEAKMIALENQIAFKEGLASGMEIGGRAKTEAYLELVAAELDALVKMGELSAGDAEAKMISIENAVTVEAKPGSLDARTVLRAVKRVDLTRAQKDEIRDIEREAIGAYRKISRKDKQGHTELAERVKAEITELLDGEQIEQFESALKRLDRSSRRGERE